MNYNDLTKTLIISYRFRRLKNKIPTDAQNNF
jgi:hypothetical protein